MTSREKASRRTAALLVAVLLAVAAAAYAMSWLQSVAAAGHDETPAQDAAIGPALQSAPQLDLARYRAQKQRELDSTGPVPGEPGFARIPLGQAMDLMAERGLRASPTDARGVP